MNGLTEAASRLVMMLMGISSTVASMRAKVASLELTEADAEYFGSALAAVERKTGELFELTLGMQRDH